MNKAKKSLSQAIQEYAGDDKRPHATSGDVIALVDPDLAMRKGKASGGPVSGVAGK